jgi:hypothetical protein
LAIPFGRNYRWLPVSGQADFVELSRYGFNDVGGIIAFTLI